MCVRTPVIFRAQKAASLMNINHLQTCTNTIPNNLFKLGSTIVELSGVAKVGYTENSTVLATFGELDTALTDVEDSSDPLLLNIADRYSVEGSHDATSFDYTFTIKSK